MEIRSRRLGPRFGNTKINLNSNYETTTTPVALLYANGRRSPCPVFGAAISTNTVFGTLYTKHTHNTLEITGKKTL